MDHFQEPPQYNDIGSSFHREYALPFRMTRPYRIDFTHRSCFCWVVNITNLDDNDILRVSIYEGPDNDNTFSIPLRIKVSRVCVFVNVWVLVELTYYSVRHDNEGMEYWYLRLFGVSEDLLICMHDSSRQAVLPFLPAEDRRGQRGTFDRTTFRSVTLQSVISNYITEGGSQGKCHGRRLKVWYLTTCGRQPNPYQRRRCLRDATNS